MPQAASTRDVVPEFAAGVRAAREAKGWTQAALAERAATHPQSIARLETGARAASLRLALRIAAALGVSVDRLARGWDGDK